MDTKENKIKRPLLGKFRKLKLSPKRYIKEIGVPDPQVYQIGQNLDVGLFSPGEFVDIIGTSKGRGFQGGVKRWHWSGGPQSHGSMSHRAPGSIGRTTPGRVIKGHHLPGHMGNQRVTVQNLEVLNVDKDNHLLVLKGSVPGHNNGYLIITKSKKKKTKVIRKEAQEEKKTQPDKKGKPAEAKK